MKFSSPAKILSPGRPGRGFTFLEILIVIAIIGILMVSTYPSILNTLHTRALENAARTIATDLQWAKHQAVKTKINHRLHFVQNAGVWNVTLQSLDGPLGDWQTMRGYVRRVISADFNVAVSLPNDSVVYNSLGLVEDYLAAQNSITLQSDKLRIQKQPDVREIRVFIGGTVEYIRTASAD